MGSIKFVIAALVVILAVTAQTYAQEDDLSLGGLPSEVAFDTTDVKHTTLFPDYTSKTFPTNTLIDTYTSFINNGQKSYNVTSIYGSINDVNDPSVFLQNLTRLGYNVQVDPGNQFTFEFQFIADPAMESRDYHLFVRADFHDVRTGMPYSLTLVNSTIALTEQTGASDWTGTVATIIIIGGTVAYVANQYMQKKAKKAAKSAKMASQHDDVLAGTNLKGFGSSSATSPKASGVTSPKKK